MDAVRHEDSFRLVNLAPMPPVLDDTAYPARTAEDQAKSDRALAETGYEDWYQWQQAHWGSKGGDFCFDHDLSDDGQVFTYRYDTQWEPLSADFLRSVRERFPSLEFEMEHDSEDGGTVTVFWEPFEICGT